MGQHNVSGAVRWDGRSGHLHRARRTSVWIGGCARRPCFVVVLVMRRPRRQVSQRQPTHPSFQQKAGLPDTSTKPLFAVLATTQSGGCVYVGCGARHMVDERTALA